MCGIAGVLRVHQPGATPPPIFESVPEWWLDILDDSIRHRGPDGAGRFRDRAVRADGAIVDVAFVHRRLSIIDHAGGHQPMVSPTAGAGVATARTCAFGSGAGLYVSGESDWLRISQAEPLSANDRVAVIFNGCIYNHRELRAELQAAGHVFSTDHSDTEVIVHGWREWGDQLASHLDGMYAIVIWDRARGDVWLGQDYAHEKRLYTDIDRTDGSFVFTVVPSGLPRLAAAKGRAPQVTSEDWLRFGASSDPCTVGFRWPYHRMMHSSAEHIAACGSGNFRMIELPFRDGSSRLALDEVDDMISRSVRSRLEADVSVGCFLSGGVDSSLIAWHAKRASERPLKTFCVRMPVDQYDESAFAEHAARIIGSDHATLECRPSPASDLVMLIQQLGLPFGDSSLLPTYWVSKAAREVVTVAISGDGGDELFMGYDRYVAARWLQRAGWAARPVPTSMLPDRNPRSGWSRLRRLGNAARNGYAELLSIFSLRDLGRLMPGADFAWYNTQPFNEPDPAGHDFWTYLPDDLLRKTDTASMSVGLELRSPLLSPMLIDRCLRAPVSDLMPRGQRKGFLRNIARRYFPSAIVDRPKMGFSIPVGDWFRTDYGGMRTLLLDHLNSVEPFGPPSLGVNIDRGFVQRLVSEHDEAGASSLFPWKGRDHSQRLYMLLVFSIWTKWLGSLNNSRPEP